jgi:hypothetical protein
MARYFILFFIVVLGLFTACNNQTQNRLKPSLVTKTGKKKSPGKIEFTKEIHNFGTLKDGETVVYSFKLKNTGGEPFHLTKVEPTCGCLSVQYSKNEIESQDSSIIDVIFHTEGEWGNQFKTVSIETSVGEAKTLTIGAYVENKNFNIDLNNLK